ncbi:MAG: hypothetical protein ACKN9T_06705 [Candidatus Methylumidiphilus sp.]
MKFNPFPWLAIFAALALASWARASLIEPADFGFFCDGGGQAWACHLRWLVLQSFSRMGLGYFALFLGLLALVTRSDWVGMAAGMAGMAGLVLYCWDYSAVGLLLGVLTLARAQLDDYRAGQAGGQPQL